MQTRSHGIPLECPLSEIRSLPFWRMVDYLASCSPIRRQMVLQALQALQGPKDIRNSRK